MYCDRHATGEICPCSILQWETPRLRCWSHVSCCEMKGTKAVWWARVAEVQRENKVKTRFEELGWNDRQLGVSLAQKCTERSSGDGEWHPPFITTWLSFLVPLHGWIGWCICSFFSCARNRNHPSDSPSAVSTSSPWQSYSIGSGLNRGRALGS